MDVLLIILFYVLFIIGAFVFAAVGMGGATFYIPVMLLYGYEPDTVATTCLVLNIIVAALSFIYFRKYFEGRYFWPVLVGSVPGSFLGGYTNVDDTVFVIIVIVVMLLTAAKLIIQPSGGEVKRSLGVGASLLIGIPLGLALGYVSGIIGIGGGIFLSPLLILAGLVRPRTAAAIAGLFIVINSVFALGGHLLDGDRVHPQIIPISVVVVIGGIVGAYLGSRKLPIKVTQWILAGVILLTIVEMGRSLLF
jgi:uncharacterized membrane protein YfcA